MCSCDSQYFNDFAIPLAYSATENGNNLHIHIINPTTRDYSVSNILKNDIKRYKKNVLKNVITVGYEEDAPQNREYYSCNRFIIAPYLLKHCDNLMIVDADCLVMNHVSFPDADLGLYLREPWKDHNEWETMASHVAAGIVYYTKNSIGFAEQVSHALCSNDLIWFIDQVALWVQYKKDVLHDSTMKFIQFDNMARHVGYPAWMDWEFKHNSLIWTGKGDRKYTNENYLAVLDLYRSMWDDARTRFWYTEWHDKWQDGGGEG
jgi:hypothetical protein